MNRRLLIFLLGVVGIFAIGCAVQGQPFEKTTSPPGTAVIYVYRPYSFGSVEIRPAVTCGEDTARIGPGGYHAFIVPAGQKVSCSAQTDTADEVEFQTERRTYYIREELGWGNLTSEPHLNPIDTDKAQTEIQSCVLEPEQSQEPQSTGSAK
jgi:hypothetical protein